MNDRVRRLTFIVLAIIVLYTITVVKFVSQHPVVNPWVDSLFVFLTSVGFYQLLIDFMFRLVGAVPLLLRLYWGRLYVHGLWSYTYTLDGKDDDTIYFGVWRFEQTLYDTQVVGFGLTKDFRARSRVRSATDMINNGSMYEVINIRVDSVDSARDFYSRTSMYFELNRNRLFRYPVRMRGHTVVYGGPLNGRICNNVFIRHESAQTEEDVIQELKRNYLQCGRVHPEAAIAVAKETVTALGPSERSVNGRVAVPGCELGNGVALSRGSSELPAAASPPSETSKTVDNAVQRAGAK